MITGRPEGTYTPVGNLMVNLDRYYRSIGDRDNNGCIPWTGPWHRQGYGMLGAKRQSDNQRIMTVAHRVTAMLHFGRALTSREFVIHTCSNVRCQEPTHLVIGDYVKKAEIMTRNGRSNYCGNRGRRGPTTTPPQRQANRKYKYTDEEILWIRSAASDEIAARYHVTKSRAAHMRCEMRKKYLWLKGPNDETQ